MAHETTALKVWTSVPAGRALLATWTVAFAAVTARALTLRKPNKKPTTTAATTTTTLATRPGAPSPMRRVLRLALPSYKSETTLWISLFSIGIGLRLAVSVKVSSEVGVLGSLLAKRDWTALYRRQLSYALWAIPAAALTAWQKFTREQAALCMRAELMERVHGALTTSGGALPHALATVSGEADGGAVQICVDDSRAFCSSAVDLFEGVAKPLVEVTLLSAKLASMMGGRQLAQCYAFFAVAGSWTRFAGPSIASMTANVQAAEGELLAEHAQLAEYSEEVALLRGGAPEATLLKRSLGRLVSGTRQLQLQRSLSDMLDTYVLRHMGILSAFGAMLPAVMTANPTGAAADPTEYFLTSLHLLVNVGMACKDLVLSHKKVAELRAYALRVDSLVSALEAEPVAAPAPHTTSPTTLLLKELDVLPPDGGEPFARGLNLRLDVGDRVIVRGPNGCGKSSLLRTLLGLWKPTTGVAALPEGDLFVLPQRPYLLATASIEQLLLYPRTRADWNVSDGALRAALAWAGLEAKGANLTTPGAAEGLSGGEKQRLVAARLWLTCEGGRPPALALLDEPTAACEAEFERKLFDYIVSQQLSTVTISHSELLTRYHTHQLHLDGHGGWVVDVLSSVR